MTGPLDDLNVVELSAGLGAYAGRLLATMGASVLAVAETEDAIPSLVAPNRSATVDYSSIDFTSEFHRSGRDWTVVGPRHDASARSHVAELVAEADILITGIGGADLADWGLANITDSKPLVHLSITPYGLTGPKADAPATDLTVLAAGGLLSIAGEPSRPPTRPYGHQSAIAASLHGLFGALAALRVVDLGGPGQVVDVSAQDAVAHSLENASQYWDLEGVVRSRTGVESREAGNGVFQCVDGEVYLMTTMHGGFLGWDRFVTWVRDVDPDLGTEYSKERWQDMVWRRTTEAKDLFRESFESLTRTRSKRELYKGGQTLGVNIVELADAVDLLASEQLSSRDFFVRHESALGTVVLPGPPFRFSGVEMRVELDGTSNLTGGLRG
jgi:benzylsuccinate CoA-transferase BbsE subunit